MRRKPGPVKVRGWLRIERDVPETPFGTSGHENSFLCSCWTCLRLLPPGSPARPHFAYKYGQPPRLPLRYEFIGVLVAIPLMIAGIIIAAIVHDQS